MSSDSSTSLWNTRPSWTWHMPRHLGIHRQLYRCTPAQRNFDIAYPKLLIPLYNPLWATLRKGIPVSEVITTDIGDATLRTSCPCFASVVTVSEKAVRRTERFCTKGVFPKTGLLCITQEIREFLNCSVQVCKFMSLLPPLTPPNPLLHISASSKLRCVTPWLCRDQQWTRSENLLLNFL